MKIDTLKILAGYIAKKDTPTAIAMIAAVLETETGKHWQRDLKKLAATLEDNTARFKVYAKDGNGKLPFLAFSSLPGEGFCPGAGPCLEFCYSFKAWRYPAAFCRQAQNSHLSQSEAGRNVLLSELDKYNPGAGKVRDFRLYVDGDFDSVATLDFWMKALQSRPWLNAYGYSKSFVQFLAYEITAGRVWPDNYKLNLSSGHKHSDAMVKYMAELPVTRGEFIVVDIGHKVKSSDHADRAHQKELRTAFGAACFTCPGKCGECTPKGHACGSDRFAGIPIVIAVH